MIGHKFQIESTQSIFRMDDIFVKIKIKSLNIKLKEIHLKRLQTCQLVRILRTGYLF